MNIALSSICNVPGVKVGHAHNFDAKTGCTAIIVENGAVAGVDIRGSAPGTREIEAIKTVRLVEKINAILFSGGSAFGLDAAGGVQKFLEEKNIGYDVGVTHVPIVPTAVIFDLHEGDFRIRPDKKMGYEAAMNANKTKVLEGRVGAGAGATVGKILGQDFAMKGGIGTVCDKIADIFVGALVVVNALGDVVDPNGVIIAGARKNNNFINTEGYLKQNQSNPFKSHANTTLAVIATDAKLDKEACTKIAQMAQDGFARAIRPAHTPYDGDLIIALSTGEKKGEIMSLGMTAANVVCDAIIRAVKVANS